MNHGSPPAFDSSLAAFGLAVLLVGCGAPFTSPEGAGGDGGASGVSAAVTSGAGAACDANHACGAGFFCFDAGCGVPAVAGTCQATSATTATFAPMCGCDGVTYWSSRFGAASSRSMRASGACSTGLIKTCATSGQSTCSSDLGERCVYAQGTCGAFSKGACWVVPAKDDCDGTQATARRCDGPKPGCDNLCAIINDGKAFRDVNGCSP